jgi:hypothetical protein
MYCIDNHTATIRGLSHEIAHNGETGDRAVSVQVGVIFNRFVGGPIKPGTVAAWLSTNGGPTFLASYDADGNLLYSALAEVLDEDARDQVLGWFGWDDPEGLDLAVAAYLGR